jgi:ribosomal protein S18 acetylase RimI-like enzyme
MDLRLAASADLPAVHALIESAYRGDSARRGWTHEADLIEGDRTDLATLSAILAAPDKAILVLEDAGETAGSVFVADMGDGLAYLGMLCVAPRRQAAGLGKRLISAAESFAVSRFGARVMEMTVIEPRPELIAYYQRRGYALTGERRPFPVSADFDLLVLRKPLG